MMADLEDVRMKIEVFREEAAFHGFFHIASEEEGAGAELDAEGEGVVIAGFRWGEAFGGREELDAGAGEVEGGGGVLRNDGDVQGGGASEEGLLGIGSDPELAGMEVFE